MASVPLHIPTRSKIRQVMWGLLVLLSAYVMALAFTAKLPFAYAVGCDAFGYMRQAELIRAHGLQSGLDTQLAAPEADFLKKIGREINPNPRTWSEMIAPHCHHYRPATDKIIMQYPPGTGMVLALMPEHKMLQALSLVMVLSILFFFSYIAVRTNDLRRVIFNAVITAILLAIVTRFQVASYSIPVTIIVITWVVWLLALPRSASTALNCLRGLVIGLLCGLMIDVRIASVLLLPIIAVMLATSKAELIGHRRYFDIAFVGIGFFLATIPLLVANKTNAGGFLTTTYGEYDTSVQWRNVSLIQSNIEYYFLGAHAGALLAILAATLVVSVGVLGIRPRGVKLSGIVRWLQRDRLIYLALMSILLLNVGFFSIKPIAMDYYLVPALTLCVLLAMVAISETEVEGLGPTQTRYRRSFVIFALVLGLLFGADRLIKTPIADTTLAIPEELLRNDSIVYADTSGGTIYTYQNKYTSKIAFGSACMQEQFVHHVARAGRDQYFVIDSPKMKALVHRLGSRDFSTAGVVKSQHINFPVVHYKPNPADDFPNITCDFNSAPSIVSQLDLKVSGQLQGDRYVGVVELINRSDQAFSTQPNAFPIRLAWRVLPTVQSERSDDSWPHRIDLNLMIRPKSVSQIPINIPLSNDMDGARVEFSLVQEGLAWFHERGMKPATAMISTQ